MNTEREYDVTALGELLIDFTDNGLSEQGNPVFEANPGGAPCNVLSMLSNLGKSTSFIGKVGNDGLGRQLVDAVKAQKIDCSGLQMADDVHTTLAFVHKLENGDRDFSFYRKPGADMMLTEDEVNAQQIQKSRIFHFGSLSLTDEPVRAATEKAIRIAEEADCLMSFDPNLRPPLWSSNKLAKEEIIYGLAHCDILKIADNEITWLTGREDYDAGIAMLQSTFPNIQLICLSLGPDGSVAYYGGMKVEVPAFLNENTIETTGAGDTFGACILNYILENGIDDLSAGQLREMLTFANAAASIVTTRKGALRVMPTREEVEAKIKEENR